MHVRLKEFLASLFFFNPLISSGYDLLIDSPSQSLETSLCHEKKVD